MFGDGASKGMHGKQATKGKLSRREFLKAGAAGLGVVALGGIPRQVFGAPAVIKGTKLAILQGTYFIPAAQELYKKQAQEWGQGQRRYHGHRLPELARSAAQDRRRRCRPAAWILWSFGPCGTSYTKIISWTLPTWPKRWAGEAEGMRPLS